MSIKKNIKTISEGNGAEIALRGRLAVVLAGHRAIDSAAATKGRSLKGI